jgi:hypothetical protein
MQNDTPGWSAAMPSGPVAGTRITPEYAALVARDAFFWAWPLVNMTNRRATFSKLPENVISGGNRTMVELPAIIF